MKRSYLIAFLSPVLVGLIVLFAKSTQAAPPPPTWATWEFKTVFVPNQMVTNFYVHIGYNDAAGNPVILDTRTERIPCDPRGNVSIPGYYADFNGGHALCLLPDVIEIANQMVKANYDSEEYLFTEIEQCQCDAVEGGLARLAGFTTVDGENPVFFHPTVQFNMPTAGDQMAHYLALDSLSNQSNYQSATGLYANYQTDVSCNGGACQFDHAVNSNIFETNVVANANPFMWTDATTVYIGLDPTNGDLFTGRMKLLHIVPGCYISNNS